MAADNTVPHYEGFHLRMPSQFWEVVYYENMFLYFQKYTQYTKNIPWTSNMSHTLVDNKTIDHSDVVETSPVDAAPTPSSFLT